MDALEEGASAEQMVSIMTFDKMPLEAFLRIYGRLTGRTVLFGQGLNLQTPITYRPVQPLTVQSTVEALDTVLALNQITTVLQGEHFVVFVPAAQANQVGGAFTSHPAADYPEAAQFTTHIVQVEHIDPVEATELVKMFASAQGANGIVTLTSTKTIVLRDYAMNVKRMLEVLERVDVEIEDDYTLEVIPIKYGRVEEIYMSMQSVISGGGGVVGGAMGGMGGLGGAGGFGGGGLGGGFGGGGFGGGGFGGGGFGGGGVGGFGGNQQMRRFGNDAERILMEMEAEESLMQPYQARNTRVGGLQQQQQRGGANTFQQRLNQVNTAGAGTGAAGFAQLLEDASITGDARSNSLIVYASKKDMARIKEVVEKVDTLLAQVLIEAIIMEVSMNDSVNTGVQAAQRGRQLSTDPNVVGGGTMNTGSAINTGNNFLAGLASATNAIPSGDGLSYFLQMGSSWDVALSMIASDSRVNVVQRPRVLTSHATPGSFQVGSTVPFVSGAFGGGGFGNSINIQREFVGIGLNVMPFITPDHLVVMEISQEISQLGASLRVGSGDTASDVPITQTRSARSTVTIHDKDAILLGGYITTTSERSKSGVPVLQNIPVLGHLFSSRRRTGSRTELMVLMRPTILSTPADAAAIADTERQRLPGVKAAEREFERNEAAELLKADRQIERADRRAARR